MIRLGNFSDYRKVSVGLAGIGLIFGLVVSLHYRFMPTGILRESNGPLT